VHSPINASDDLEIMKQDIANHYESSCNLVEKRLKIHRKKKKTFPSPYGIHKDHG
jgi:hypothetical protein